MQKFSSNFLYFYVQHSYSPLSRSILFIEFYYVPEILLNIELKHYFNGYLKVLLWLSFIEYLRDVLYFYFFHLFLFLIISINLLSLFMIDLGIIQIHHRLFFLLIKSQPFFYCLGHLVHLDIIFLRSQVFAIIIVCAFLVSRFNRRIYFRYLLSAIAINLF